MNHSVIVITFILAQSDSIKRRALYCQFFRHLRNEMSQAALERIQNLSDEDIFLSFDADELPKKEVRLFLGIVNKVPNAF